jgi:AcrR family transcriptional regulator
MPPPLASHRRTPIQARSRDTVERILTATAELIEVGGVESVTTRAIAAHANIATASLYRFFTDRDEILGEIFRREIERRREHIEAGEPPAPTTTLREFISTELASVVEYCEDHRVFRELLIGEGASYRVTAEVRLFNRNVAQQGHAALAAAGFVPPDTDKTIRLLLVELADRILEVAFRGHDKADPAVIAYGTDVLCSYIETLIDSPQPDGKHRRQRASSAARPTSNLDRTR